ncbi:Protein DETOXIFICATION 16 [Bienertia sinuspersici]
MDTSLIDGSTRVVQTEEVNSNSNGVCSYDIEIWSEAKRQIYLAGPLIAVTILQFCIQIISLMFVGHLDELSLSSASLGNSFASVTGFYVLLGMSTALETLCGQSYGARQYEMLGIYTQRAMIVLMVCSIPLSVIWFYTTDILILLRQNHEIAMGAGVFNKWMIPSLFGYGLLQCLTRFLQTQCIVLPMVLTSCIAALLHVPLCWALIFKLGLGIKGAALANVVSYWLSFFLLAIYVKVWNKTWNGLSKQAFFDIWSFLKLAIPSAFMICLEYWSFEMVVLLAGLLPKPQVETSVLSISLNTCWMVYMISVGLGAAVSTRVSNELGAGRPNAARLAFYVMGLISVTEGLVVAIITISIRHVWGRLYSDEEEVVRYVSKMMLLLAVSDFLDGFQCALSGAARGCGWQKMCSFINFVAYYIVAVPLAVLFAFVLHMGGMGLWLGIICGLSVAVIVLVIVILCTNWEKVGSKYKDLPQDESSNS